MPKRKRVFTRRRTKARKMKAARRNETVEERENRLASAREISQRWRESQSEAQRENYYRYEMRRKQRLNRRKESDKQRRLRNEQCRERMNNIRERRRRSFILENEAFHYDPTKEYCQHLNVVIGKMDNTCKFCGAKKFKGETPSMCCKNGKVKLPSLEEPPPEFFNYMTGETQKSFYEI